MALARAQLIGGPYCGGTLPAASRGIYVWVQTAKGGGYKAFTRPARSRRLYRILPYTSTPEVYVYAGHTHRHCYTCGGMNEVLPNILACQMCGSAFDSDLTPR